MTLGALGLNSCSPFPQANRMGWGFSLRSPNPSQPWQHLLPSLGPVAFSTGKETLGVLWRQDI